MMLKILPWLQIIIAGAILAGLVHLVILVSRPEPKEGWPQFMENHFQQVLDRLGRCTCN